jgi:hypothetical protein
MSLCCHAGSSVIYACLKVFITSMLAQVEAEKLPEISGQLEVTAVPTFVFLQNGNRIDTIEGFDPEALYAKTASFNAGASENAQAVANPTNPQPGGGDLTGRLKQLVSREPVMLFMKGTPDVPRCGFSRRVVEALKAEGVPFGYFDILSNEEVSLLDGEWQHCKSSVWATHTFWCAAA